MFRKLFYLVFFVFVLSISFPANAELVITNGDFEAGAGAGDTENVSLWYDDLSANFWESAWELDRAGVTPNGSMVVVFCSWNTVEGDPLTGSYVYQSIGTSTGESSVTIGFDWGHPDDAAADRHDGLTVSVLASDGSFVASDGNDVLGAEGVTLLDSASYSHVSEGTDGEIFPVAVTLDLSGANEGNEIFLRFNNYLPEAGADPWPILDNVQITDMAIGFATPVIDGEVDDIWADAAEQYFVPLEDPNDGSGTWKALYDAENLYVLVDVTDESLQNDSAGSWQDDSVEIYFDGGNTKLSTALSGDDHQYTFGWTTEEIQGTNIDGYTEGIEHAQVDTETGWRIEVKMPWMSIWGVVPQAGDLIGIDCYYNDDDDGGDSREGKMLGFSAVEGWNDASQWGTAVLAAKVKPKPKIAWVSYHAADDEPHADAAAVGFTQAPDIEYTDLLNANGYNVTRVLTTQSPDVDYLNTFDLVIISRTASSGHYSGSGASLWNSITAPMINLNGYTLRSSRLGITDGTTMVDTTGDVRLAVTNPDHPIFAGIALTDGVMDNPFAEGAVPLPTDETIISRGISINNNNLDEEGTILATVAEASADTGPVGGMIIAELPAGATMQNSSGSPDDVLGGPRLVFLTGSREPDGVTGGQAAALYDLYPDGEQMFLNAVDYMIPVVPVDPGTDGLVAHYAFENDTTDSSGNGLDGTAIGDPTFAAGVAGMALDFNGDDYVDCGGAAEFSFTEAMTVSTWVNIRSRTTAWMAIIAKGENAWRLGVNNETTAIHYAFTGGTRGWLAANTATELNLDQWYHVAATYDMNVGATVYIDGVADASNPDIDGIVTNEFSLFLGENPEATGRLFDGMLDEIMIYNRALSEEEILFLAGE